MKKITALAAAALLALAGCGAPAPTTTSTTTVTAQPAPSTPSPIPDTDTGLVVGMEYIQTMSNLQTLYGDLAVSAGELDFDATRDIFIQIGEEAEAGMALQDTGNAEFDAEWSAMLTDTLLAAEAGATAVENYDAEGLETAIAYLEKANQHVLTITEILEEANA